MTVALQRVSSKEQIAIHRTRVPFRVMVLYGLSEYHGESNPVPANPFMEEASTQQQVIIILVSASTYIRYKCTKNLVYLIVGPLCIPSQSVNRNYRGGNYNTS